MVITEILSRCRGILEEYYGPRFKGLILYGSTARHEAEFNSDIDLLVLLDPLTDYFIELKRIIDLLYPMQLESDRLISAKPAPWDGYQRGSFQLYRLAKKEGVAV